MHSLEVLLVEDHAGEILLIRQILSRSSSPVRLHVAMDGEQALQILGQIRNARATKSVHRNHIQPGRCRACGFRSICDERIE